jgi:hypothetical protein
MCKRYRIIFFKKGINLKKDKLLIIISTDNIDSIMKFPLLYGGVSLPRIYWKELHIMFWGASIIQAKENKQIRQKVIEVQKTGVKFSSCIVCAQEYNAVEKLEELNIQCNHTGELLTHALKDDSWSVLTI